MKETMNTPEEERISSRHLPGPEREPGQETTLLPLLHPPPAEELEVGEGSGSARWRNRQEVSHTDLLLEGFNWKQA